MAAQGFEAGDQVYTRKSLAELSRAAVALRTSTLMYFASPSASTADAAAESESSFRALLRAHVDEFLRAPGRAWYELMANDLGATARARMRFLAIEKGVDASLAGFEQTSRDLDSVIESELQRPAWQALTHAAGRARVAAEHTERQIISFNIGTISLIVLTALVILFGIERRSAVCCTSPVAWEAVLWKRASRAGDCGNSTSWRAPSMTWPKRCTSRSRRCASTRPCSRNASRSAPRNCAFSPTTTR